PQRRSGDPDSAGSQNVGGGSQTGSRSRGLSADQSRRSAAPAAHPDFHEAVTRRPSAKPKGPESRAPVLFTEPTFLFLFLPILLALYFVVDLRRLIRGGPSTHGEYGNWLLLIASIIFYVKGGGAFTWLMLGSITFNYWMAIAVDRARTTSPAA